MVSLPTPHSVLKVDRTYKCRFFTAHQGRSNQLLLCTNRSFFVYIISWKKCVFGCEDALKAVPNRDVAVSLRFHTPDLILAGLCVAGLVIVENLSAPFIFCLLSLGLELCVLSLTGSSSCAHS